MFRGVWGKWTIYDRYFLVKGYGASEHYMIMFPTVLNRPKCLSHIYLEVVNVIFGYEHKFSSGMYMNVLWSFQDTSKLIVMVIG